MSEEINIYSKELYVAINRLRKIFHRNLQDALELKEENILLKQFAKEAMEKIEFYSKKRSWAKNEIDDKDIYPDNGFRYGGKCAQKFKSSDLWKQAEEVVE